VGFLTRSENFMSRCHVSRDGFIVSLEHQ
jgi:hypothetical protein